MTRSPDPEKNSSPPAPRVILLDGALGERLRPLALAWASLGQTLAMIGPADIAEAAGPGGFPLAMLDLQLAIERAGGICLALDSGGSAMTLHEALARVVDALGGIDLVVVPGGDRAAALLAAMDGLPRRVRPGWVLTGPPAGFPHGPRVAWAMDGQGEAEAVARQALNL